ncbi:hypothetical protein N2K95_01960 [Arthrobacter zhaoxinii]|uniref:Uncharacterized protein n=1 Tax=Arthrobacter zhaoxinii TaxID=2964616 RepID=A0ABY5YTS0_9MICC|nr:hypothetical protein [Arthrobacter zhaoxinii]UWX97483.1 hypothetical protein N2K95_01960 [Arthrobacter zhaoxinii]
MSMAGKGLKRSGAGRIFIGLGFLIAMAVLMANVSVEPAWQIVATLLAALLLGFCFLRFPSRPWVMPLVFVLLFGVLYALDSEFVIAWVGGYGAGANFGAGWKAMKEHSPKAAMKSDWTVNGHEFGAVTAARDAAGTAMRNLDGKAHGRLDVEHGFACFQVLGSVTSGFLCHWNHDVSDEDSWAVLTRVGYELDDWADVPAGRYTSSVPVRLINDLGSAQQALDDFFRNPDATPEGPNWPIDEESQGTRLSKG